MKGNKLRTRKEQNVYFQNVLQSYSSQNTNISYGLLYPDGDGIEEASINW